MVITRRAIASDSAALAHLAEQTFRDTFSLGNNPSDMELYCEENFHPDIQHREILDPNIVTILAEFEGELIGFAQVRLLSPKDCVSCKHPSELCRLYVANKWHGREVAHKMMPEVFACAATVQSDCIWLGVWEHNLKAIAFYRKYDFNVAGEHLFQFGSDPQRDLVMVAPVSELSAN